MKRRIENLLKSGKGEKPIEQEGEGKIGKK